MTFAPPTTINAGSVVVKADGVIPQGWVKAHYPGGVFSLQRTIHNQYDLEDLYQEYLINKLLQITEVHMSPYDTGVFIGNQIINKRSTAQVNLGIGSKVAALPPTDQPVAVKFKSCECGSAKCGIPTHSSWCPLS